MTDTSTQALQSVVTSVLEETVQDWDLEIEEASGPGPH